MKKVLNVFFKILKIIFIVFLVIYLFFVVVHKISSSRSIFHYRIYTVKDNTMLSKYEFNDIVLVKDINSKKLVKNNIIAFYDSIDKRVVFHKIVDIKDNSFTTKGIKSNYTDPTVSSDMIIGKVVNKLVVVSFFNHILSNIIGFFLLIVLPLIIILLGEIYTTMKEIGYQEEPIIIEIINEKKKQNRIIEE